MIHPRLIVFPTSKDAREAGFVGRHRTCRAQPNTVAWWPDRGVEWLEARQFRAVEFRCEIDFGSRSLIQSRIEDAHG